MGLANTKLRSQLDMGRLRTMPHVCMEMRKDVASATKKRRTYIPGCIYPAVPSKAAPDDRELVDSLSSILGILAVDPEMSTADGDGSAAPSTDAVARSADGEAGAS